MVSYRQPNRRNQRFGGLGGAAVLVLLFPCLLCVIEKNSPAPTAAVEDESTTQCLVLDQERTERRFCRLSISTTDLDVSLAGLSSVLSDVTAPAVRLSDASVKNTNSFK